MAAGKPISIQNVAKTFANAAGETVEALQSTSIEIGAG
jgi:hypothetical protein